MNKTEKCLEELVKRINDRGHLCSIKAEFEAEGTRADELLRLLDITRSSSVPLTLKIGGCEALKDLYETKQFGASYIVAPMIESTYALKKYCSTIKKVYSLDESQEIDFLFNIETISGFRILDELLEIAESSEYLKGIVFGRTDFAGSLTPSGNVDTDEVARCVKLTSEAVSKTNLDMVVGGAISIDTIPLLKEVSAHRLTRFETRKVVFHRDSLLDQELEDSLLDAVHFEILWLINKSNYYGRLHQEDQGRINVLESRWNVLSRNILT